MRQLLLAVCGAALLTVPAGTQGRTHDLTLAPEHVHWGYYDAAVKPVLRVASGDTIRVEAMVARGLPRLYAAGVKDAEIPESLKAVEARSPSAARARIRSPVRFTSRAQSRAMRSR